MGFSRWKIFFAGLITITILAGGIFFISEEESLFSNEKTEKIKTTSDNQDNILTSSAANDSSPAPLPSPPPPPKKLDNPPEIIKAVYVTGWSAGYKSYLNYLSNLFEITEINAVVVDIKDYSGLISYKTDVPEANKYNLYNYAISDINSLVRFFHDKNIYIIGRISVFEDPAYSKARPELAVYDKEKTTDVLLPILWKDNKGLSWIDPASKEVWDYNVSLAKDAFSRGFDEINFDYIRFPSDGNMKNMGFPVWDKKVPMRNVIKEFFQYLRVELPDEKISADLFGLTTVKTDDLGIGQILEDAFENFDYISPMVYPSHYAIGFIGFQNPAEHPYEVVKYSLDSALIRKMDFKKQLQGLIMQNNELSEIQQATEIKLATLRPWLQDFNMGAYYTTEMVEQEIKATQDALGDDFNGFMLWNPSNIYTQGAVLKNTE